MYFDPWYIVGVPQYMGLEHGTQKIIRRQGRGVRKMKAEKRWKKMEEAKKAGENK